MLVLVHPKHEWERCVCIPIVSLREERDKQVTDVLVLKGEDKTAEGFTAVDEDCAILADEHVACLEQDPLEDAHNVVNLEFLKQESDRLVVDMWQLIETGHAKLCNLLHLSIVDWHFSVRQVQL